VFAVLFVTAAFSVSLGIFAVAYGEINIGRETSQASQAFNVADSGAECALLWRFRKDSFASAVPEAIDCAGQQANTTISSPVVDGLGNLISVTSTFDMNYDGHHYRVQVMRNMFPHPDPRTVITVFGENTDVAGVKSFQEMRVWDIDF
jgi:hypothetical protein